ncbi:MAG: hypothetical protein Q9227_008122 [Pyrenula ochraceoflavens]
MACLPYLLSFFPVIFYGLSVAAQNTSTSDVLQYVNQLIGAGGNGGNVFAGASIPFGMAKAVADVSGANTGGFSDDGSNVTGFSSMHDSGTGGNPSLGNFPLFPQYCPGNVVDSCVFPKNARAVNVANGSIKATPGYFGLTLANGISAEMTTTRRTALYRFNFPPSDSGNGTNASPLMLLDLTDLNDSRQNATVRVMDDGRIMGNGTFLPSFGSGSFVLHFCVDFQGATVRETGINVNSRAGSQPKELFVTRGINAFYIQAGAYVQFNYPANGTISARMGMSFISADQACSNAQSEIPDWDFEAVRNTAADAWRDKLSVVSVQPGLNSTDMLKIFYTGLYRTMMSPQDYTGENPLWQSTEPYFDSFYCIWDSFRTDLPLLTLTDPGNLSRMLRSLLDTYAHLGWLPDCRMSLCKGFTQGGSNADVVFADAYIKNISNIDWQVAWQAVVRDAEDEPLDWSVEGRGGLQSWKALNYIPYLDYDYLGFGTNSRSISRTLEYSYNDFTISELGQALGKNESTKYLARSGNWQNIFKADQRSIINGTDTGFVGFFQPKFLNGTWGFQDPIECSPLVSFCSLTSNPRETFESSIWEYQFFVPHDMSKLIELYGGPQSFVSRLQYLHDPSTGLSDFGNEVSFLTPFQYHYASRPGLSASTLHNVFIVPSRYSDTEDGLPGNDDSGAGGSFVALSMMGLFPVAGQDVYLITAPFFESWSIRNPLSNVTATVTTVNFDPGYQNIYVQSATLNGEVYTKNWIGHDFFAQGMTLELTLGSTESDWGTSDEDLPPSPGAYGSQTRRWSGMKVF